jgi:(+)-trans-carveol dehydrogenase/(-)-trans-carveol dehydrogenase
LDLCGDVDEVPYAGATRRDLDETVAAVRALGRRAVPVVADTRDGPAVSRAVAEGLAELGRLDLVCANAGIITAPAALHEMGDAAWDVMMDVNVKGVWNTCRATVPHMLEMGHGGSIVLTSSVAGLRAYPSIGNYVTAKHAIVGLMRTLAVELAPHGIRVNSVHPTQVPTPMIMNDVVSRMFVPESERPTPAEFEAASAETNLLPVPWVEPVDVSNAVLFLVSDEARYVTGVTLPIDAGSLVR